MFSNCSCFQSSQIMYLEQEIKKKEMEVRTNAGEPVKIITNVDSDISSEEHNMLLMKISER